MSGSDGGGGGGGSREVAYRVFAAEYDDATLSYSESEEERAPNYVVTPTGARVNRLFAVGVLTEVEPVNEEMLRARVVDPTGAFVVYAGQYQPDALAFLERTDPPAFVAVTGKARTFEPEDGDRIYTSVRPESISEVDADTRDRWVVQTAEQTIERVETMAGALADDRRGEELAAALAERGVPEGLAEGVPLAVDHYGTTATYLAAVRDLALDALRVVAGERDEVEPLQVDPDAPGGVTPTDLTDLEVPAGPTPGGTDEEPEATGTTEAAETGDATVGEDDEDVGGAEPATTPEPDAAESTPEPETEPAAPGSDDEDEGVAEPGPASGAEEPAVEAGTDVDVDADADAEDELGDFDPGEFELDEEERREVEEEFGTEFETGTEVDAPGEADIEPESPTAGAGAEVEPEADEPAGEPEPEPESETESGAEEVPGDEAADESEAEPEAEAGAEAADEAGEPAGEVDLEDAVMETMQELDDGDGADREAVVDAVVEESGADPEAVDDAIQDALMDGRCYEPDEGRLKAI